VHRALAFADSCVVLQRGRMTWSGPSSQARQHELEGFMGAAAAGLGDA